MAELLKVKTSYSYKGNRNNRVYPKEVLESAFNEPYFKELCSDACVPVLTESARPIGYADVYFSDDEVITVNAEIYSPEYISIIKEAYENIGFILAGRGEAEQLADNKSVVKNVIFNRVMLCEHPAVNFFTEIYKES